jgi:hypothetical protein
MNVLSQLLLRFRRRAFGQKLPRGFQADAAAAAGD